MLPPALPEPCATPTRLAELFPFSDFFADAPQPLFKGEAYAEDWEKAQVRLWRQRDGLPAGGSGVWVTGGLGLELGCLKALGRLHHGWPPSSCLFPLLRTILPAPAPTPHPTPGLLPPPAHHVPRAGGDPAL